MPLYELDNLRPYYGLSHLVAWDKSARISLHRLPSQTAEDTAQPSISWHTSISQSRRMPWHKYHHKNNRTSHRKKITTCHHTFHCIPSISRITLRAQVTCACAESPTVSALVAANPMSVPVASYPMPVPGSVYTM
eukprot:3589793-Rhodomonas_salina.1